MIESNENGERVADLIKALGRAYLQNGEHRKAADKFRQLYQNGATGDPEIVRHYALALARCEALNEEAMAVYRQATDELEADEQLYITLAAFFLKARVTDDPALRVFRQTLTFSPPFEAEIRDAIEKIFHETTESITIPELRQTLLDGVNNPELLSMYLGTVREGGRFEEALSVLKDLYIRSTRHPIYLKAICETLLEKKVYAEEHDLKFRLSSDEIRACLKYKNPAEPIRRIGEIDLYLDMLNLLSAVTGEKLKASPLSDEYEFFILGKNSEKLDEVTDSVASYIDYSLQFNLRRHLIDKLSGISSKVTNAESTLQKDKQLDSIAIFEIINYDREPKKSKLPFKTFVQLISAELSASDDNLICPIQDGLVMFGSDSRKMCLAAARTLQKLSSYNQVVDEFEIIDLQITLHASPSPFLNMQREGLHELRKAFKVHQVLRPTQASATPGGRFFITGNVAPMLTGIKRRNLGEFKLRHFSGEYTVFEVPLAIKPQAKSTISRERFGKYEVLDIIKQNEMCSTFRGYDSQLDRSVIVKAYSSEAFSGFKDFAMLRKQFYEEVRSLNRVNHPNVCVIYDAGEEEQVLYLVREYVEGEILNDYLLQDGPADINRTVEYYMQICKVLSQFHEFEIWHKNLKPDNVFITSEDEVKITDAGLLQPRHSDKIWKDEIDSQAYSSPEQIQSLKLTHACDNFQLGVMLYESITGIHPFRAKSASEVRIRILADEPDLPSKFRHDIPKELNAVIMRSLMKDPNKRFASIHEFSTALGGIAAGEDTASSVNRLFDVLE